MRGSALRELIPLTPPRRPRSAAALQLAGAVLDVTDPEPLPADHPLWVHPKVRIFPHRATVASEGVEDTVACCIGLRERALKGEPIDPAYELDWCATWPAWLAWGVAGQRRPAPGEVWVAAQALLVHRRWLAARGECRTHSHSIPPPALPSPARAKGYCGET